MPEINNDAIGWMINIPKDRLGLAHRRTVEERSVISSIIQERLYTIVKEICSNPRVVQEKGMKALEHIRDRHKPEQRAEAVERIYEEALKSP
jgi:hypothetical protein